MKTPEMFIVAGPPGAGKSSVFPLGIFAARVFNADDRAAELNGGSYSEIPLYIRHEVIRKFEQFVHDCIAAGCSFGLETNLRSHVARDHVQVVFKDGRGYQAIAHGKRPAFHVTLSGQHSPAFGDGFVHWQDTPLEP